MRLRTVTSTRWPAKCADGCGTTFPPDPNVKVVEDFDTSKPRLVSLQTHSLDYGTYKSRELQGAAPSRAPAPAPPQAQPKAPGPRHGILGL